METYRHGSYTVFSIHLHLVWITKYQKKFTDEVSFRVCDIIREIYRQEDVEIIKRACVSRPYPPACLDSAADDGQTFCAADRGQDIA
ncbi:MAG: transposase [Candidatus Electronema sp. V4]|uniref:transposase n=1 Tax=Candidatus Electronema sp. V4 TaxID=3454756 RepID=UPI0040555193